MKMPSWVAAAAGVCCFLSSAVHGAEVPYAGIAGGFDKNPDWKRRPHAGQLAAAWPRAALKMGVGGAAVIDCVVGVEGTVYDCRTEAEQPEGMGFGDAAISLAPRFLFTPALRAGKPAPSRVKIPITFNYGSRFGDNVSDTNSILAKVRWDEAPTYADVVASFPAKAREKSIPGRVGLTCHVAGDGHLSPCEVLSETPKGKGFGRAALDLAGKFRAPLNPSGSISVIGMTVVLPIAFPTDILAATPRVGSALWVELPTSTEMNAGLPDVDATTALNVTLDCLVAPGGRLSDCKVENETPAGYNVGPLAVSKSVHFSLTTWTADGLPTVGGRVRVPINYRLDPHPKLATAP